MPSAMRTGWVMGFITVVLAVLFSVSIAYSGDTKASLGTLKAKLNELGAPKLQGTDPVAGKTVPAIYFGTVKINNNFDVVDAVVKTHGGTATVFVKAGDEFIRVSTNVLKADGTRAIGTPLARNKAYEAVTKGETFCGEVTILDLPYDTCYEPIKAGGQVIGIYYVGYKK